MAININKFSMKLNIPLFNRIVFESNPEMTGNVGAVYQEFLKREINKKYKFVWCVSDKNIYKSNNPYKITFIDYEPKKFYDKLKKYWIMYTSKALVFENRIMIKKWKNQFAINLTHGMPIKSLGSYKAHDTCDYVVSICEELNDMFAREMDVPREKMVTLGYPRTDVLGKKTGVKDKCELTGYNKIIVWMPTFRKQSVKEEVLENGKQYPSGVPLLETTEDFAKMNEMLIKTNCCLIVKLHPAQETRDLNLQGETHIKFWKDDDLLRYGVTTYELLAEADALITDYSSVYFDFLLTDNPIGLVIDDIEDYEKNRGLAIDYKECIKGDYIASLDELIHFVENVSESVDLFQKERMWAKKKWCAYTDFLSTERVCNFILDNIERK